MMFMSAANGFSVFFAGLYGTSLGLANAGLYFTLSAASMVVEMCIRDSALTSLTVGAGAARPPAYRTMAP